MVCGGGNKTNKNSKEIKDGNRFCEQQFQTRKTFHGDT